MAGQMKAGEEEGGRWRQGRDLNSEVSLAGRSQGGEEGRSRHAGYVMIIVEQRGRLFFALNTGAGRQDSQAGVQKGEAVQEDYSGVENKKKG